MHSCIGNGVGCDLFPGKVKEASWINGVWGARMGGVGIVARVTPENSEEFGLDS